ncbi:MAG: leucine-rich repeat domain-containing protein [Treponema sp.]|nr:leucine-rich repeat domain-containing protein [Treponema sp.]
MFKKIIIIFVFFALFTKLAVTIEAQSFDSESDFIVESIGDSPNVRITGYNINKAEVRIPRQIRRMTVVAIGDNAFFNRGLRSVTIPVNVFFIGKEAFAGNELNTITIGSNVFMYDNSFNAGFYSFYLENNRRAGTYIFSNGNWSSQVVIVEPPAEERTAVTIAPPPSSGISAPKLDTYIGFSLNISFWDYGPSSLVPGTAFHLGLITDIGKVSIGIMGEGGGFLGVMVPDFEDIGISYGSFFGSFIEFFFNNNFGFNIGGGIIGGSSSTRYNSRKEYFFPFSEINLIIGDEDNSLGLFFRYYFNDSSHFYDKFSVGIKRRGF